MTLTSQLFGNVNAQRALAAVTAADNNSAAATLSSSANAASTTAATPTLALSFAPVRRANIDLFARAPQACKPSRRDKRRMAQQQRDDAAKTGTATITTRTTTTVDGGADSSPFDVVLVDGSTTSTTSAVARRSMRAQQAATVTTAAGKASRTKTATAVQHVKPPRHLMRRHALHTDAEEDARTVFVGNLPNTITKREVYKLFKRCGAVQSVRVRCQALLEEEGMGGRGSAEPHTTRAGGAGAAGAAAAGTAGGVTAPATSATRTRTVGRAVRVLRGDIKKDDTYSATAYVLFKPMTSEKDSSSSDGNDDDKSKTNTEGNTHGDGTTKTRKGKKAKDSGNNNSSSVHPGVAAALQMNGVLFRDRHLVVTTLDVHARVYAPETSVFLGNLAYTVNEEQVWSFFVEHGVADVKRVRLVRDRESGQCKGFGYVEFVHRGSVEAAMALRGLPLCGREVRIVHVNKATEAKAATLTRREQRRNRRSSNSSNNSASSSSSRAGQKRARGDGDDDGDERPARRVRSDVEVHPWMGVVTNPRRKIPRDLRPLAEGGGNNRTARRAIRAPVKHKLRNPEKHARKKASSSSSSTRAAAAGVKRKAK